MPPVDLVVTAADELNATPGNAAVPLTPPGELPGDEPPVKPVPAGRVGDALADFDLARANLLAANLDLQQKRVSVEIAERVQAEAAADVQLTTRRLNMALEHARIAPPALR